MKTKFELALLLALMSSSGMAFADWVKVASNELNTGYADPATIVKKGDTVTMWALLDFKTSQPIADKPGSGHRSQKAHFEYDCKDKRAKMLAVIFYSENMGKGNPLNAGKTVSETWHPVPPLSGTEKLWNLACGKR